MDALDRIVVGQNDGTVTYLLGQRNQLCGGVDTVGICRMKVTICKHDIIAFRKSFLYYITYFAKSQLFSGEKQTGDCNEGFFVVY
jgi:hypothetical protein